MHTIASFVDWVALLNKGDFERYDNVFDGIREYTRLFMGEGEEAIERLLNGGDHVQFENVELSDRNLPSGGSFTFTLPYTCTQAYEDIEIDIAIYDSRDPDMYFQATNRAYGTHVDLKPGKHTLSVTTEAVAINGSVGTIVLAIWAKNRTEHLFWWRVPIEVASMPFSTGKNFLPVRIEHS